MCRRAGIPHLVLAMGLLAAAGLFSGCGGGVTSGSGNDLSGIGAKTDPSWHNSYLVGAHGGYVCGDCHVSVARTAFREIAGDQICARCHMDAYGRTGLFNHSAYKIGTHCNSCHYSDSFISHTRISHSSYHEKITANCLSCHPEKTPASHYSDGRTKGCEGCHKYPSWRAANFNHAGVTSGCASCHTRHYAGYPCEACHTSGISWRYRHSTVRNDGCPACHGSGGGDGEHDGNGGGRDRNRA